MGRQGNGSLFVVILGNLGEYHHELACWKARRLGHRRTAKAWPNEDQKLTLLHRECTECPLGPVGSNSLSAVQPASRNPHHHGHLWATGSHLRGSGHIKAKSRGEVLSIQRIRE